MKISKKIISLFLVIALLTCSISGVAIAAPNGLGGYIFSQEGWDTYWETVKNDETVISLTPGTDATELNFSWHSAYTELGSRIRISENADMHDYVEFSGRFTIGNAKNKINRITAKGLEENTIYYYTYGTKNNFSEPTMYRTHSTSDFKAVFVGDIQCGTENETGAVVKDNAYTWQKTLGAALDANDDISFILSAGDQTNSGTVLTEWYGTLSPSALRSIPMATTIGNHDMKGRTYQQFVNNPNEYNNITSKAFGNNYWFRYGDVLFLIFNSNNINLFDHYNFMQQAILANEDATWRVGLFHHDFYGTGSHTEQFDSQSIGAELGSFFDKFELDVALSGHDHIYGRSYHMFKHTVVTDNTFQDDTAIDPKGTLYLTANSAGGKNRTPETPYDFFWLDYTKVTDSPIYSTLEFSKDTFTMKSVLVSTGEQVDEYSIYKTDTSYPPANSDDNVWDTNLVERVLGKNFIIFKVVSSLFNIFD